MEEVYTLQEGPEEEVYTLQEGMVARQEGRQEQWPVGCLR